MFKTNSPAMIKWIDGGNRLRLFYFSGDSSIDGGTEIFTQMDVSPQWPSAANFYYFMCMFKSTGLGR